MANSRFEVLTRRLGGLILSALSLCALSTHAHAADGPDRLRIEVSMSNASRISPVTGRLYLMISRTQDPEVRLQSKWFNSPEMTAINVHGLKPGQWVIFDGNRLATPLPALSDLPDGDYFVQAILSVYTPFHRSDGRTIWAHNDQGEGQDFRRSPGDLYSDVRPLHWSGRQSHKLCLSLTHEIPPLTTPADTEWVQHVRIQSAILSAFWGQPMYVGAVVLLPRGYAAHPELRYPIIYVQSGHFSRQPPFEFRTTLSAETPEDRLERESAGYETGYDFYRAWSADHFPRMIAVSFQHATPFGDMSGITDSENNGPYHQAIQSELIPFIEAHFRSLSFPYARAVVGKASGGRDALTLLIRQPDFFGGAWVFYPWSFDFSHYFGLNIYEATNAFVLAPSETPPWARNPSHLIELERNMGRSTQGSPLASFRQLARLDAILGSAPGGELAIDDAIAGPVGAEGYPRPLMDRVTGHIDHAVALHWRDSADLMYYLKEHWQTIGPQLSRKLHLYCGTMDHFRRCEGVRELEEFLVNSSDPHVDGDFDYGLFKGDYQPMSNAELIVQIADHMQQRSLDSKAAAWRAD